MKPPDIPHDDDERVAALHALEQLDTPPEPELDALVRVASHLAGTPIALVSLVDRDRQWFKANVGLAAAETDRAVSFCGHAVADGKTLVVPNAHEDARFTDNPLVTGDPHISFYAGAPIRDTTGRHVVGTLCVIDQRARELPDAVVRALEDLARVAEQVLRRRHEERVQEQTRRHEQHLAAIVNSTDDAIVSLDLEQRILSWNPGAEDVFGARADAVLGRPLRAVTGDATELRDAVAGVLTGDEGQRVVVSLPRGDETFVAAAKAAPILLGGELVGASLHVRDITARQQAADERDRLAAILELTPDAVAILETDGRPVYANRAMRSWVGHSDDTALPDRWTAVHPPWAQARLRDEAIPAVLRDGTWSGETAYVAADGTEIPTLQVLVGWRDPAGELRYVASVAHDIRERKNLERLKNEFISTVSHELRTPLTSIRGALGLLADGAIAPESDKGRELLGIARNNSQRLVTLVNDLLDFEKLAAGRVTLQPEESDIGVVIQESVRDLGPLLSERELTVRVAPSELRALADPGRTRQVLVNLLSNAAKFSSAGDELEIGVARAGSHVRVSVRDHGPGVPEEFIPHLFTRFAQADGSSTRRRDGTGLGLSIVQGIVELHGGQLGYEPAPDGGARFWFTLPLVERAREDGSGSTPRAAGGNEDVVLVVEDDPDISRLLVLLLEREGLTTRTAQTAGEALASVAAERPAAVTLDLGLPDADGADLVRRLRELPGCDGLPIVVVSASAADGKRRVGSIVEVVDWLDKPIDERRLLASLRSVLGRGPARARVLHVEDDADLVAVLGARLDPAIEVVRAGSLAEARELLARSTFSLVVLDLGLPDGDGLELLAELPAPSAGGPAVVLLSAREEVAHDARRVEAALTKSRVDDAELARVVEAAVRRRVNRERDAPDR